MQSKINNEIKAKLVERLQSVFVISAVLLVLLVPTSINLAKASVITPPSPIPGNLIPTTGSGTPIKLTIPNLGIVPLSIPISAYSINQAKSGLIVSDSLTNETRTQQQLQSNLGYWTYGGDAIAENAPYSFYRDLQGLHIGIQSPANGTWAGFYAVTPPTNAMVFHSVITAPVQTIPSNQNWYENGMYVQNGTNDVNYVTCTSNTSVIGTQWVVSMANGTPYGATNFVPLWYSNMDLNQPRTGDCTIITNGINYLKVDLNGAQVYQSNNLKLNMSKSLITFMEPQTNYDGSLITGSFTNFFETSDVNVKVTNNPMLSARVDLVEPTTSSTGTVVATAPVNSAGTATLNIENFTMPVHAYIKVYDSNGILLSSTSNAVNIFGGDVYTNKLSPGINLPHIHIPGITIPSLPLK